MTQSAWSWLPDEALVAPEVLGRLDAAVEAWSERWFRGLALTRRRTLFEAASGGRVTASGPRVAVRATETEVAKLVTRAVGLDIERLELTEADQAVLAAFRKAMMDDLAGAFEEALGQPGASPCPAASGAVAFELAADDGRKVVAVETSRAALATARLAGLAPPTRTRPALASLRAAIADLPVRLSVRLGSAAVALPEVRRLGAGDVVILDRGLDEPLVVASGSPETVVACARMADGTSPRSLRLEPA